SISGSSQPLYVVDGVPIQGGINGLNADNIESINVLKGANAAALYGSDANNGGISVTTNERTNDLQGSFSEHITFQSPVIQSDYKNVYGQGNDGEYSTSAEQNWGPKMEGQEVEFWSPDPNRSIDTYALNPQPDNVKDAFQRGYKSTSNLSISTGTEHTQY